MVKVDELRPRSFDLFMGQEKIVEISKRWLKRKDMPNVICVGPPGTGKTTWIYIQVSGMFGGANVWDEKHPDLLWLNASDERGINTVRNQVKDFAQNMPATDVPFRVIVLEEGDQLTPDAQDALRSTTELYMDNCRFIYSGNRETYIPAIKSRCSILHFPPLPDELLENYFTKVCGKYGVKLGDGVAMMVSKFYKGDMRRMINDCLEKLIGIDHEVTVNDLDLLHSLDSHAISILALLKRDAPLRSRYQEARKRFTALHKKYRFDVRDFLKSLSEVMGKMSFDMAEYFSEIDARIALSGRNKEIHVGALLARLAVNVDE